MLTPSPFYLLFSALASVLFSNRRDSPVAGRCLLVSGTWYLCLWSQGTRLQPEAPPLSWEVAVAVCLQHPGCSLLAQPPPPCPDTLQGSRRWSQMCSSHQHYQRQYCSLGLSSTSTLPLIFLSINSVPFYAAFFCSNAWHSFSNTKLDELGLLGSSKAGPYSAAADLPASCCTLTHFTHTMGSETPSLLCWSCWAVPGSGGFLDVTLVSAVF